MKPLVAIALVLVASVARGDADVFAALEAYAAAQPARQTADDQALRPKLQAVVGYPSTPAKGRRWSYNGGRPTVEHLASEHGFDLAWLRTLSQAQLEALHGDAHDGAVRSDYVAAGKARRQPAGRYVWTKIRCDRFGCQYGWVWKAN